jgi:hypothetical protein
VEARLMSKVVYIVVGEGHWDETSYHWNARAFDSEAEARDYIPELGARIEEYLPKLSAYLVQLQREFDTHKDWEQHNAKHRAARERFRLRVGDAGFAFFEDPESTKYKIETLEVF